MVYKGKYKIIDNFITACDYGFILSEIKKAIKNKEKLLISPIASHTLIRAHYDKKLKKILDEFDYLVPDSQWVRWSIPFLYGKERSLENRVYGPKLMLKSLRLAEKRNYKVFLYGNTSKVLTILEKKLINLFPGINICGKEESKFRGLSNKEDQDLAKKINKSGANIIFISLGSPKQEVFSYKLSKLVKRPLIIIPVGAAFDFISENKLQAPKWMRKGGLEWFFRFSIEPVRLFDRYFFYGFLFLILIFTQKIRKFNYRGLIYF